jgi:hypothetical protein
MNANKHRISVYQRIMLVFLPLFLLVMLGFNLWTSSHLHSLSKWETVAFPGVIIGLTACAIVHLFHWFNFTVELSDHGVSLSGMQLKWEDLESVHANLTTHFSGCSTLIELRSKDGQIYNIPVCIQRNSVLLREIRQRLPEIK